MNDQNKNNEAFDEDLGWVEFDTRRHQGQGSVKMRTVPCVTGVKDAEGTRTLPNPSSRVLFDFMDRTVTAMGEKNLAAFVRLLLSAEDELLDDPEPEAKADGDGKPAAARKTARDKFVEALKEASDATEIAKCDDVLKLKIDTAVNGNLMWGYSKLYEQVLKTPDGKPAMRYFVFDYFQPGRDWVFDLTMPIDKLMEVVAGRGMTEPIQMDDRRSKSKNQDKDKKNRIMLQPRRSKPFFRGGYVPETILVVKRPDFRVDRQWVEEPVLDAEGKPVLDDQGKVKKIRNEKKTLWATTPGFAILLTNKTGVRIIEHFRAVQRRIKPELDGFIAEQEDFLKRMEGRRNAFAARLLMLLDQPEPKEPEPLELDYPDKGVELEPTASESSEEGQGDAEGEPPPDAPTDSPSPG